MKSGIGDAQEIAWALDSLRQRLEHLYTTYDVEYNARVNEAIHELDRIREMFDRMSDGLSSLKKER